MDSPIVRSPEAVTLLGAGQVSPGNITEILRIAPFLVAADGGANVALRAGVVPDLVIGDLDSLTRAAQAAIPAARIHRVSEQETTDFEKCLTRIEAPVVLCLGFTGNRVDHALAVWNTVVRHPERGAIILSRSDVAFTVTGEVDLPLRAGTRVSLFPMARVRARSEGLHWPVDRVEFAPDGAIGTSNLATGPVRLWIDGPGMIVILPRACLGVAIAALSARPRR
jgi:thiamine pyrophosphokinase